MKLFRSFFCGLVFFASLPMAHANLCDSGQVLPRHHEEAAALAAEGFSIGYANRNESYDARVIGCNRQRDSNGYDFSNILPSNENIENAITATHTFDDNLPNKIVRGHYSYFGLGVFSRMRYGYQIARDHGTWMVTVPIELHWPTSQMTDMIDIPFKLAHQLGLDSAGGICNPGATSFLSSDQRKVERGFITWELRGPQLDYFRQVQIGAHQQQVDRHVSNIPPLVLISSRVDIPGNDSAANILDEEYDVTFSQNEDACRVPRNLQVSASGVNVSIRKHLRDFWKTEITAIWNRNGFVINPVFVGCDTASHCDSVTQTEMTVWNKDETIWQVHLNLKPYHRAAYKRMAGKWNNMYSGTAAKVIGHEIGHELGLDDEYGELSTSPKHCTSVYSLAGSSYIMCNQNAGAAGAQGVYAWIITRRYAVANDFQCAQTSDCDDNEFCAKQGLKRNVCEVRRGAGEACGADDDKCARGLICAGKPAGKCVAERSTALGQSCDRDAQCTTGFCGSDKRCQCKLDTDCIDGYCDKGTLTVGKNRCISYKQYGDNCSADRQCRVPNLCLGKPLGRCAAPASRNIGQACVRDGQCRLGKCGSNNVCVCTQDLHCGSGQCKKPVGGNNYCRP